MESLKKSDYAMLPEVQRINTLATEGTLVTSHQYYQPLDEDEIAEKNVKLNAAIRKITFLELDRKDISSEIKEEKKIIEEMHKHVTDKFISVTEDVYDVVDIANNVIETINKKGEIIDSKILKKGTQLNMYKEAEKAG